MTDRILLRLARDREWPEPAGRLDPGAAIELVRRSRYLQEDVEDPSVPKPELVWFDPSTVFADGLGPAQQAWQFTFEGDQTVVVVVNADGTEVLATFYLGDPGNDYQHFTTPRFALDPVTGVPRFVTFHPPLALPSTSSGSAVTVAGEFFSTFPKMFGTAAPAMQLQVVREETDLDGGSHVVFDQYHGGVPVHGCQLLVHLNAALAVTSVSGRFFREPDVDIEPTLSEGFAFSIGANDWVTANGSDHLGPGETIESRGLVILPWRLVSPNGSNHLAWWFRYPDHDRFVSAHTGRLLARLPASKYLRRVFDALDGPPGSAGELHLEDGIQRTTNPLDPEAAGADAAIAATDAFFRLFARNSWDGRGGGYDAFVDVNFDVPTTPVLETNASWNGKYSEYSRNFAEADVVAHEFTHGLNDATANLVYLFEPGALDESYADVLGKLIAPTPQPWVIGVGVGFSRNMGNPVVGNYGAFAVMNVMTDFGGVHSNSGIGNRGRVSDLGRGREPSGHRSPEAGAAVLRHPHHAPDALVALHRPAAQHLAGCPRAWIVREPRSHAPRRSATTGLHPGGRQPRDLGLRSGRTPHGPVLGLVPGAG